MMDSGGGQSALFKVLIIADEYERVGKLSSELAERGLDCSVAFNGQLTAEDVAEQALDLVLVAVDGSPDSSGAKYLAQKIEQEKHLPVIALLSMDMLTRLDPGVPIDDFVMEPWDATEVALRVKRALRRANGRDKGELIECDDLLIDLDKCMAGAPAELPGSAFGGGPGPRDCVAGGRVRPTEMTR